MSHSLAFKPSAERELRSLPRDVLPRIVAAIKALADEPRPRGCVKLSNTKSWRIRVGTYRVIYDINDKEQKVEILHLGHRREVYR